MCVIDFILFCEEQNQQKYIAIGGRGEILRINSRCFANKYLVRKKKQTTKSRSYVGFLALGRYLNIFYIMVLGSRQNYLLSGSIDSELKSYIIEFQKKKPSLTFLQSILTLLNF